MYVLCVAALALSHELSMRACDRDWMAHGAENSYCLALYRRSLRPLFYTLQWNRLYEANSLAVSTSLPAPPPPQPPVSFRFLLVCVAFLFLCVFVTQSQWGDQIILAPGFGRGSRYNLCPQATILKPKCTSRQIADYRTYKWESQLLAALALTVTALWFCRSFKRLDNRVIVLFCWERQSDCVVCGMECQSAHLCSHRKPSLLRPPFSVSLVWQTQASWVSIYPIFLRFLFINNIPLLLKYYIEMLKEEKRNHCIIPTTSLSCGFLNQVGIIWS